MEPRGVLQGAEPLSHYLGISGSGSLLWSPEPEASLGAHLGRLCKCVPPGYYRAWSFRRTVSVFCTVNPNPLPPRLQ